MIARSARRRNRRRRMGEPAFRAMHRRFAANGVAMRLQAQIVTIEQARWEGKPLRDAKTGHFLGVRALYARLRKLAAPSPRRKLATA